MRRFSMIFFFGGLAISAIGGLALLAGSPGARAATSAVGQAELRHKPAGGDASQVPDSLVGVWTLVRVDNVYPDGHRIELYGPHPQGLWIIDARGHYMMQMVRAKRAGFASNDKSKGTPQEYRAAAMDSNAHYGEIRADGTTMHRHIEHASFPNWDGKNVSSPYTLKGDMLTYTVAAPSSGAAEGAHGEVEWQRLP